MTSTSAGAWAGFAARTAGRLGAHASAPLDRRQHRLAVGVAALVVAHLAQLGGREVGEALGDLRGGQVVVAEDRERRADAGGAARACRPGGRSRRCRSAVRRRLACRATALDVGRAGPGPGGARMPDQAGRQLLGVVAGHPAAAHGVLERLADALARQDDSPRERLAQRAHRLEHRRLGGRRPARAGGLARAALRGGGLPGGRHRSEATGRPPQGSGPPDVSDVS